MAHARSMTITEAPTTAIPHKTTDTVVLDGALFFQPPSLIDQLERYAHAGLDVSVRLPTDGLDASPLTGVSRTLVEAAAETSLRNVLHAAGYRHISRRVDTAAVVLDARA